MNQIENGIRGREMEGLRGGLREGRENIEGRGEELR